MKRTTSREMAAPISEKIGIDEAVVRRVLLALDDEVGERVVAGEIVEVSGLGTFKLKVDKTTKKNIPKIGLRDIPSKYDVQFNPSKALNRRFAGLPPLTAEEIEDENVVTDPNQDGPLTDPTPPTPVDPDPGSFGDVLPDPGPFTDPNSPAEPGGDDGTQVDNTGQEPVLTGGDKLLSIDKSQFEGALSRARERGAVKDSRKLKK